MNINKQINIAIRNWRRRIDKGEIAGKIDETTQRAQPMQYKGDIGYTTIPQSSLDESCWLIQFQGLEACYNCEALATKQCGGGYKFLFAVLEDRGYRYPSIFLMSKKGEHLVTDIKTVQRHKNTIIRALRHFFRKTLEKREYEQHKANRQTLDEQFPYEIVREKGKRLFKGSFHYAPNRLCTCIPTTRKGAYRDEAYKYQGKTVYYYHQHAIVVKELVIAEEPKIPIAWRYILDSCGYRTYSTKERINRYLPRGFHLYQHNHVWYISTPKETIEFFDGIELEV